VNATIITYLQTTLNANGFGAGPVDGIAGPRTLAAIDRAGWVPAHWSAQRKLVGSIQVLASQADIDAGPIDGYWGPQTDYAWQVLQGDDAPRPAEPAISPAWPATDEQSLVDEYGEPGTNQVRASAPYPLRIAWDTGQFIRSFQCHEAIKAPAERAMSEVLRAYGADLINDLGLDLFGGCFNHRVVRGGDRLSTHSWGIAIDWDPENNPLRANHTTARFAGDEYADWLDIWAAYGFMNLGRAKDYDWMHHRFAGPVPVIDWRARADTFASSMPINEQTR